jgi:hypothetical protein
MNVNEIIEDEIPEIPYSIIEKIAKMTHCRWTIASIAMTCKHMADAFSPNNIGPTIPQINAEKICKDIKKYWSNDLYNNRYINLIFCEIPRDPFAPKPKIHAILFVLIYSDRIAFMRQKYGKTEVPENLGIFRFKNINFSTKELFEAVKKSKRSYVRDVVAGTNSLNLKLRF